MHLISKCTVIFKTTLLYYLQSTVANILIGALILPSNVVVLLTNINGYKKKM